MVDDPLELPEPKPRRCRYCGVLVIGIHEVTCRMRDDEEIEHIEIQHYRVPDWGKDGSG